MTGRRRYQPARTAVVALALSTATCAILLLQSTPAWARDDGEPPGKGMRIIETLLWFVGAPVALFVVIALLVLTPSMSRGPRYRPGLGWWAAPIWFNGPADDHNLDATVRMAVPTADGGGSSARW